MPPRRTLPLTRPPIRAHLLRCLVGASLRRGRATSQSSHSSAPRIWTLLGARTKRRFASRSGFKQRPGFLLHDKRRFASAKRTGNNGPGFCSTTSVASLREADWKQRPGFLLHDEHRFASRSGVEAAARIFAPRQASLRFAKRIVGRAHSLASRAETESFAREAESGSRGVTSGRSSCG